MEDSKIIEQILWGKSFVEVRNANDRTNPFILRSLSIKETNFINYIYNRELEHSLHEGVLSIDQLKRLFSSNGLWTEKHEQEVFELQRKEKIAQAQIKDFEFIKVKKDRATKELSEIRDKLKVLNQEKQSFFSSSAENRAEEIMRRYMIMLSTETIREEPYWPTEDRFLLESDFILVYNLAIAYYENNIFDDTTIRKVARSANWRTKWAASKNGADLFGRPIPEWSEMQNYLVYWSQFYDYVYESMERPGDHIIENDEACDAWIREQNKKAKANTVGTKNIGSKMTGGHQEQFLMVSKDTDTIKKVQDMNTTDVRRQLRSEYEIIKKKGTVSEWKLRGGQYADVK